MQQQLIQIISHRGGALLWPENSLEAFRHSIAAGVDGLECDVHLSSDDIPVVIHDPTLDRTTMETGTVSARSAEALARVRLRHHDTATIPNLTQLADLVRDSAVGLQVEIKGRGRLDLLQRSLAVIDAAGIRSRTSVIAFDPEIAAAAVTAGGLAGVFWLLDATLLQRIGASGIIEMAAKHGVRAIEADIAVMDTALCDALREADLRLGAWGANDEARLLKAFELKLDVVATDDPVLALRLRQG